MAGFGHSSSPLCRETVEVFGLRQLDLNPSTSTLQLCGEGFLPPCLQERLVGWLEKRSLTIISPNERTVTVIYSASRTHFISSSHPLQNGMLLLCPLYRGENQGPERLSDFPKVTVLVHLGCCTATTKYPRLCSLETTQIHFVQFLRLKSPSSRHWQIRCLVRPASS